MYALNILWEISNDVEGSRGEDNKGQGEWGVGQEEEEEEGRDFKLFSFFCK